MYINNIDIMSDLLVLPVLRNVRSYTFLRASNLKNRENNS